MTLQSQQKSIRITGRKADEVIIQVNDDLIGFDDGREVHLFHREDLTSSLRVTTVSSTRDRKKDGRIVYRPLLHVLVSFTGKPLSSPDAHSIEVLFKVRSDKQACRLKHKLIYAIFSRSSNTGSDRHNKPQVKRSFLSAPLRFVRNATVLVAAAYVGSIVYVAATSDGVELEQSKVQAWGTSDMKPYGALNATDLGVLKTTAQSYGFSFEEFGLTPKDAKAFYVLSQHDCDECAELEEALTHIDPSFVPSIIPADVTASRASLLGALHAYCSDEPTATWLAMSFSGQVPAYQPGCSDWREKVSGVQLGYKMSGLDEVGSLPAIVAPNGAIYAGSVSHIKPEDRGASITQWLEANSGKVK